MSRVPRSRRVCVGRWELNVWNPPIIGASALEINGLRPILSTFPVQPTDEPARDVQRPKPTNLLADRGLSVHFAHSSHPFASVRKRFHGKFRLIGHSPPNRERARVSQQTC